MPKKKCLPFQLMYKKIENSKHFLMILFFSIILILRKIWRKTGYEFLTQLWIQRVAQIYDGEIYLFPKYRLLIFWENGVVVYKLRIDDEVPRSMSMREHEKRIESIRIALEDKKVLKKTQDLAKGINFNLAIRIK